MFPAKRKSQIQPPAWQKWFMRGLAVVCLLVPIAVIAGMVFAYQSTAPSLSQGASLEGFQATQARLDLAKSIPAAFAGSLLFGLCANAAFRFEKAHVYWIGGLIALITGLAGISTGDIGFIAGSFAISAALFAALSFTSNLETKRKAHLRALRDGPVATGTEPAT